MPATLDMHQCWRCVKCEEHRPPARVILCEDPGDWVCRDCTDDVAAWDAEQEW